MADLAAGGLSLAFGDFRRLFGRPSNPTPQLFSGAMLIAERILKIRRGRVDVDVPIRIFAPQRDETAWACRYEIGWPGAPKTRSMSGFDAVQALSLTLQAIGAELYQRNEHASGRLLWEKEGGGYGFPVPRNIRDLLVGDDAKFGG